MYIYKLGKPKRMKKINDWSAHIVRHFWHCSSECRKDETTTDEEALKVMKVLFCVLNNVQRVVKNSNSMVDLGSAPDYS